MKKVIRNICAFALATGMLLPVSACSSKNKTGDSATKQESEVESTSDNEDPTEGTVKKNGEVKNLSKNPSRIVKETDPYFNAKVVEIKPHTPDGKEIESAEFWDTCVVGDRVLANIHYQLKKSAATQDELDNLDMSDNSQWDRYQDIWDEHSYNSLQLFDLDGNNLATIPMEADFNLNQAFPIGNDEILVVTQKMDWNDCSSVPKLFVISTAGKKLRDINLDIQETLYYMKAYQADNGNLIIAGQDRFYLLDPQGKLIKKVEEKNLNSSMYYSEGKLYATINKNDQTDLCSFQEVDTKEGKLVGDLISISQKDYIAMNDNMDCLIFGNNGVEQYSVTKASKNMLASLGSADINFSNVVGGKIFSEDRMVLITKDTDEQLIREDIYCAKDGIDKVSIVKLDRAATNPYAGKEILKLGICDSSSDLCYDEIVAYNTDPKSHARIEVINYPLRLLIGYEISDQVYFRGEAGKLLTQDMYSGEGPDIVIGFSDLAQLNNGNYMLDMKQYLESDSTLNNDDYFMNLFQSFEKDGKLFTIPITYALYGSAVNSFYEGAKEQWTFEDLKTMDAKLMGNMKSMPKISCNEILTYWLYSAGADFIDYDNKTVNFESDEFKAFLEVIKTHGDNDRNAKTDGLQRSLIHMGYVDGNYASCNVILDELQDYCQMIEPKKGGKTLFTGYPSEKGTSMCAKGVLAMSIAATASNPELAWEFIRSFLNEDVQQELSFTSYSFPVNKKAFYTNCQKELELSETEHKKYEHNPSSFDSEPRLTTQQDIDGLAAVVSTVERSASIDSDILDVLVKEADAYLYGYTAIDKVCGIIQLKATDVIKNR